MSEIDQISNPFAKETKRSRLWWTANFRKDGWNRILNNPSIPANIPKTIWQTVALNQFMDLILLSQHFLDTFKSNSPLVGTYDDESSTIVVLHALPILTLNNN